MKVDMTDVDVKIEPDESTISNNDVEPELLPVEEEPVANETVEEADPVIVDAEVEKEEEDAEEEPENKEEPPANKSIDDDLDRRNPQYIPKGGAFYEHDNRTLDLPDAEEPAEAEKKKKVWKESKTSERWLHDCYVEDDQIPKSAQELCDIYGYDIRNEENAPRARRRRKYGRGPDKYERKWDDEKAYIPTPNRGRGRGRRRGGEEFPPLPKQNGGPIEREPPRQNKPETPPGPQQRRGPSNNEPRSHPQNQPSQRGPPPRSEPPGFPKGGPPGRPRMEDHIKPFRTDGGAFKSSDSPRVGRSLDNKPLPPNNKEIQDLSHSMGQMGLQQKPKSKDAWVKDGGPDGMKNSPAGPGDIPANRQNPKRYSKIRKGFSEYFPPEDCPELDPRDAKAALERQVSSAQNRQISHLPQPGQPDMMAPCVMAPGFPEPYSLSNATYVAGRQMMPMAQPGLRPQAPIQQALSPQMASMEMPPQPSFVPPPMYIDIGQGEVVPFQGYPTYPQGQNTELYQASSGITYYSPEIQTGTGQSRALPQRRKAAIPIVPPPEH